MALLQILLKRFVWHLGFFSSFFSFKPNETQDSQTVAQEAYAINISHDYTQFHSCNLQRTKFQLFLDSKDDTATS